MKPIAFALLGLTCLLLLPAASQAGQDRFGKVDTIYADVAVINGTTATVTVSYFNDENVVGLQIPFKMDAGMNKIVADSAIYTGGRIAEAKWAYPGFRPDTAIQCVTLGMIANIGPTDNKLTPGIGRIVTVFISSLEDKKIENFTIDTTTVARGVSLMAVADLVQGNPPDSVKMTMIERQIKPAWVIRYAKK
jgi:hypothetical protein